MDDTVVSGFVGSIVEAISAGVIGQPELINLNGLRGDGIVDAVPPSQ